MKTPPLQTAGVYMLGPEHAPALQLLAANPALAPMALTPQLYRLDAARQFIERQLQERAEGRSHVFVIKDHNEVVGVCGLHDITATEAQQLGYWIGHEYWDKGYATFGVKMVLQFAFQNLGLTRVTSTVLESNAASRGVVLNNGFQFLRIEPHREPLLKRPQERLAVYKITRRRWLDLLAGPVLAGLRPNLKQILEAELAAGNEISETSNGWPEADSLFVKLRHPFRTRPDPLPPEVDYTEPNSTHGWSAEYSTRSPRHIIAC